MSEFKWDESHRANRTELLNGVIPTMPEIFHEVEISKATQEEKSLIYIMLLTSCRISEACACKVEDIHIYLKPSYEINYNNSSNYAINPQNNTVIDRFDISKVVFNLANLKRKNKKARKSIPISNNELFTFPIWHLIDHMRKLNNPQALLYSRGRKNGWWVFKKYENINKVLPFAHATRHISLSNLTKNNIDPATIKEIAGWTNLNPFSHYTHLNTAHIEKKLKEAYGEELERLTTNNKPLSLTQAAAAHLAAYEVGRGITKHPTKPKDYSHGRPQLYKYSTISNDGELINERVTPAVRHAADELRRSNPYVKEFNIAQRAINAKPLPKKEVPAIDADILQVV